MTSVTIEVIYGRLMTKLVVVFHMLSIIHGLTNVQKKNINLLILAMPGILEKVNLLRNNAIICQNVNFIMMMLLVMTGVL